MPDKRWHTQSLRQSIQDAELLAVAARIDGVSVAEFIRTAIADAIERRRADPDFKARLRDRIESDQNLLRRIEAL